MNKMILTWATRVLGLAGLIIVTFQVTKWLRRNKDRISGRLSSAWTRSGSTARSAYGRVLSAFRRQKRTVIHTETAPS